VIAVRGRAPFWPAGGEIPLYDRTPEQEIRAMLIRPGSDTPFPNNDLAYLAFLVTLQHLYIDLPHALEDATEDEPPLGFLHEVPLLALVPTAAQVDLLAEVWARHDAGRVYRATLLDAAVLSCACDVAVSTMREEPHVAQGAVEGAPRQLDIRLDRWTRERLQILYPRFWHFDPAEVDSVTAPVLADFPRSLVAPLLEAANRQGPSPQLGQRLRPFMHSQIRREFMGELQAE
jgi:hypothetical protein